MSALRLEALPFTDDILRCLRAHCLHSAFFRALLFKNQRPVNDRPQETAERITLSSSLPLFYPSLFSARKVSLVTRASSHLHPPIPSPILWLERVASECQMYYRVSHGNVNTQGGLASLLPFAPLPRPLSSPLSLAVPSARGVEKAQNSRRREHMWWERRRSEGRSRSIEAVVYCINYCRAGERWGGGGIDASLTADSFYAKIWNLLSASGQYGLCTYIAVCFIAIPTAQRHRIWQ